MPLHINLLHEEQSKIVERKRDPLKIGILILLVFAFGLYGYYLLRSSQASHLNSEKGALESQYAKISPKSDQAKTDENNANLTMASTETIEKVINDRFYWGPLFSEIIAGTGPEIQITSFDGAIRGPENISVTVVGVSAGKEPRGIAERFRQSMQDRLKAAYGTVGSQFVTLENSDTPLQISGKSFATANFSIAFQLTLKSK